MAKNEKSFGKRSEAAQWLDGIFEAHGLSAGRGEKALEQLEVQGDALSLSVDGRADLWRPVLHFDGSDARAVQELHRLASERRLSGLHGPQAADMVSAMLMRLDWSEKDVSSHFCSLSQKERWAGAVQIRDRLLQEGHLLRLESGEMEFAPSMNMAVLDVTARKVFGLAPKARSEAMQTLALRQEQQDAPGLWLKPGL